MYTKRAERLKPSNRPVAASSTRARTSRTRSRRSRAAAHALEEVGEFEAIDPPGGRVVHRRTAQPHAVQALADRGEVLGPEVAGPRLGREVAGHDAGEIRVLRHRDLGERVPRALEDPRAHGPIDV